LVSVLEEEGGSRRVRHKTGLAVMQPNPTPDRIALGEGRRKGKREGGREGGRDKWSSWLSRQCYVL
jgi:hypothetical protein